MYGSIFASSKKRETLKKVFAGFMALTLNLSFGGVASILTSEVAYAASNYSISVNAPVVTGLSVAIAGTASGNPYVGQITAQHVAVLQWGDGTASNTSATFTAVDNSGSFSNAWSSSHVYTYSGTFTIKVQVYHGNLKGAEASEAATQTFNVIVAPLNNQLTVVKAGTGSGTVTSSPAGINCGVTCASTYASGTSVTLTALSATGSTFSGWSGAGCSGTGTCVTSMTVAKTVTATFALNAYTLTVSKTGTGSGTVSSSPAGINCGVTCASSYNYNTVVTLTAAASTGSTFTGWSGAGCSGTGTCVVTVASATSVTANFTLNAYTLTVSKSGTGSGTVTSSPAGINCGGTCSASYGYGAVVTLTASPVTGSTFAGWSGAGCSGTGTCVVTITSASAVTATFTLNTYTLTTSLAGTGSGTVSSSPAGINCGATCSSSYNYNTSVSLTASPATGSTFAGWSGACTGTGVCVTTITGATNVTATFTLNTYTLTTVLAGTGSGAVTGAGINCGTTCSSIYGYGTVATLTASPATGSTFAGWSGACTGTGTCVVTVTSASAVTATFTLTTRTLSVTTTGPGSVTSSASGITCGVTCSGIFDFGTMVTLTPTPSLFSTFVGWTGDCTGATCSLLMDTARSVTATFSPISENTTTTCSDNIDNDGDNLIDLADPDCAAFLPVDVCPNDEGVQTSITQCTPVDPVCSGGQVLVNHVCVTPAPVCNPNVNLLENASFEAPASSNPSWAIVPFTNTALKWLGAFVNPSNTDNLGLEVQNHVAGSPADGAQFAELDGYHPTAIYQNVPTIAGDDYVLSFKYSPRPGTALGNNVLEVRKDGSVLGAQISRGSTSGDTEWSNETRTFQGTGATTKVEFADVSATDDGLGTYIDGASLTCVGPHVPKATIVATKVVCDKESDLPNMSYGETTTIDANTATNFLSTHPSCHLASDWQFQWANTNVSTNIAADYVGAAGEGWNTFSPTNAQGVTSAVVPFSGVSMTVWMREVLKDGYVPFTLPGNNSNVSAEMYCNGDVKNYDNLDYANAGDGQTTYCVAFNAPKAVTPPTDTKGHLVIKKVANGGDATFNFTVTGNESNLNESVSTDGGTGETSSIDLAADTSYTVTESPKDGWNFNSVSCVYDGGSVGQTTENPASHIINVEAGDTVTCTYTNTKIEVPACVVSALSFDRTSNISLNYGEGHAVAVNLPFDETHTIHPGWTANIPGAIWVWGENPVATPGADQTESFTDTFTVAGTPTGATLDIAADNTYEVYLNSVKVGESVGGLSGTDDNNFTLATQDSITIPADKFVTGSNTLEVRVRNMGVENSTGLTNPAGLLYKLHVTSNTICEQPPVDVCLNQQGIQTTVPAGMTASEGICSQNPTNNTPPGGGGGSSSFDYWGCTNPAATNFNPLANKNDNSCKLPGDNNGNGAGGNNGNGNGGEVLGAATTTGDLPLPAACAANPYLRDYLKLGKKNDIDQVKLLQTFLNESMSANLPLSGIFGSMTKAWVKKFQKAHNAEIIQPWIDAGFNPKGLKDGTGYVYKTTKRAINLMKCNEATIPMPVLTPDTN